MCLCEPRPKVTEDQITRTDSTMSTTNTRLTELYLKWLDLKSTQTKSLSNVNIALTKFEKKTISFVMEKFGKDLAYSTKVG